MTTRPNAPTILEAPIFIADAGAEGLWMTTVECGEADCDVALAFYHKNEAFDAGVEKMAATLKCINHNPRTKRKTKQEKLDDATVAALRVPDKHLDVIDDVLGALGNHREQILRRLFPADPGKDVSAGQQYHRDEQDRRYREEGILAFWRALCTDEKKELVRIAAEIYSTRLGRSAAGRRSSS